MLVPWSWLQQWVAIELSPAELGARLAFTGLEVEAVQMEDAGWEKVVIGEIRSIEPHPDAEKLVVCQVDTGDAEPRQIVCGAKNMAEGDHVPVALPGARLGDLKIKKSKLRGVVSEGMMCSPRELGLGDEHNGLMILDRATPVGAPAVDVIGGEDAILELSITPNRGDCLSLRGLAREVAILVKQPLTPPDIAVEETGPDINELTSVTLVDAEGCPRYACRVMQGITVGPSPQWLADAITACGMRPINNVVDATNYVMLELGQPLHAFDMDTLAEHRIVVRRATAGERAMTLDEVTHSLDAEMTAICDADDVVAIAGVMGGLDTSVTGDTTNLLLESAYFDARRVSRTARALKLSSESSYRFARGVDVEAVPVALDRLAQIIQRVAGGTIARGRIDVYPTPLEPANITFRIAQIERVLGLAVDGATVRGQLEALGCAVGGGGDALRVTPPSWRSDLTREIDLIEEVARLTGYDKIPATLPQGAFDSALTPAADVPLDARVKDILAGVGLSEIVPYRFGPADDTAALGFDGDTLHAEEIRVLNPLSEDRSVMRRHALPGVLRVAGANQRHGNPDLALFEVGTIFRKQGTEPVENTVVSAVLAGQREAAGWTGPGRASDVYDAKGILEHLLGALNVSPVTWHEGDRPYFRPGTQVTVKAGDTVLGWIGEFRPEVLESFDAQGPMFGFLLKLDEVAPLTPDGVRYARFSRYPPVRRVRTYDVPEAVLAANLTEALERADRKILERATLTDVYRGDNLPVGHKSLTFRLAFRAEERTLKDAEVDRAMKRLDKAAAARCGATVREA